MDLTRLKLLLMATDITYTSDMVCDRHGAIHSFRAAVVLSPTKITGGTNTIRSLDDNNCE
mgnify:CR=1 FL=1